MGHQPKPEYTYDDLVKAKIEVSKAQDALERAIDHQDEVEEFLGIDQYAGAKAWVSGAMFVLLVIFAINIGNLGF